MTTTVRRAALPLAFIACLSFTAAHAAPDCSVAPSLSPLQKRVAAKAAEGQQALRHFVVGRQTIYQFDIIETMESGMLHKEWLATCSRPAAGSAAPSIQAADEGHSRGG